MNGRRAKILRKAAREEWQKFPPWQRAKMGSYYIGRTIVHGGPKRIYQDAKLLWSRKGITA